MNKKLCLFAFLVLLILPPVSEAESERARNYRNDQAKHDQEVVNGQTHVFKGERTYRKFGDSKKGLEHAAAHPNGRHVAPAAGIGRPPTAETAKEKVGTNKPKFMMTAKARDLKGDGNGHDKAVGAKRNSPEIRVAKTNTAKFYDVKVKRLKNSKNKKK